VPMFDFETLGREPSELRKFLNSTSWLLIAIELHLKLHNRLELFGSCMLNLLCGETVINLLFEVNAVDSTQCLH
jgi:hypothetical protein